MDPELLESGRGRGRLCSARLRRSSRSEIWSSAALWISSARTRFSCSPGRLGRCCGCLDKGDSWDPPGSCEDGLGSSLGPLRILVLIREMGPMSESVCLTENSTTISLTTHQLIPAGMVLQSEWSFLQAHLSPPLGFLVSLQKSDYGCCVDTGGKWW